jgi:hypothetical protein
MRQIKIKHFTEQKSFDAEIVSLSDDKIKSIHVS